LLRRYEVHQFATDWIGMIVKDTISESPELLDEDGDCEQLIDHRMLKRQFAIALDHDER
jgi:hypothetical protein